MKSRSTITLLLSLAVLVSSAPVATGARSPVGAAAFTGTADVVDPTLALAGDGTFVGNAGLAGSIDTGAWTLATDPVAGEAPRLVERTSATQVGSQSVLSGSWAALGSNGAGDGALMGTVAAMAVIGTDLFVGGSFPDAAGIAEADYIARWNGTNWFALGSNGAGNGALSAFVTGLAVWGADLYVAGDFINAAGIAEADYIARWNGTNWFALGSNGAGNGALGAKARAVVVSDGSAYVGGNFTNAAGIAEADYIGRWNGTNWFAVGSNGAGNGALTGPVWAVHASGSEVYVGGEFLNAFATAAADRIAFWNGASWSALGSNGAGNGALNGLVITITRSAGNVYVGGSFTDAGGVATADRVALWNGTSWSGLGSNGAGDGAISGGNVYGLALLGGYLHVGSDSLNVAGIPEADHLARWDGVEWSAVGSNGVGDGVFNGSIGAMAMIGDRLYVGGTFSNVAGVAEADYAASFGAQVTRKPDGRIKKGSGSYVGNNIYNETATGQARTGKAARGSWITFTIGIQNDAPASDSFLVVPNGSVTDMYNIRYFRGTTEITSAVVAGTYKTPTLAPGTSYLIKAKVKVKSNATIGSSVTRLVTIGSVNEPFTVDAVRFTGKRG